jgi:hypothetical protein
MNEIVLTVGVPVFNGARTIARCLESLASAPADRVRILIADNASTDETPRICREFAATRPNVEFVRHDQNRGASANFRYLVDRADTPYFAWLAADDWLSGGFLEAALSFLDSHPEHVLVTTATSYYSVRDGSFELTTSSGSFEEDSPAARVASFAAQLTDNSEVYGVYRAEPLRKIMEDLRVVGMDWLWMLNCAQLGKIRALSGHVIHRINQWSRPDRQMEVVRDHRFPEAQARAPHYATALAALLNVGVDSPIFASLGPGRRMRLALQVFAEWQRVKQLPQQFRIWPDARALFGDAAGAAMAQRFRLRLLDLLDAGLAGASRESSLDAEDVLVASCSFRLHEVPIERGEQDLHHLLMERIRARSRRVASIAAESCFDPAWKLRELLSFSELSARAWESYTKYLLEPTQVFALDGDAERYAEHNLRALRVIEEATTLGLDPPPSRISPHRKRLLLDAVRLWNGLALLSSQIDLTPIMASRSRLIRMLLGMSRTPLDAPIASPARTRKRVGLIIGDLESLTDLYTSVPAIAGLEPKRFERVVVLMGEPSPKTQTMEAHLRTVADVCVRLPRDLDDAVKLVRSLEIDILLFGSNLSSNNSLPTLLAAYRMARHQVALNPCPTSTGLPSIDWFISGTGLEGSSGASRYSERLLLIDGPAHVRWVLPGQSRPATPPRRGQRGGAPRFVSGANCYKLSPQTRRTWIELLQRVPGASLSLYPFGPAWGDSYDAPRLVQAFRTEAVDGGVDPARITIVRPFSSVQEIPEFLGQHDVYLDSFPFSGINSVLDPLLLGIPVVSLQGSTFRGNLGASVLQELGVGELLAASREDYLEIAVRLVTDPIFKSGVESRIRGALASTRVRLWDSAWFSSEFERLFALMEDGAARSTS